MGAFPYAWTPLANFAPSSNASRVPHFSDGFRSPIAGWDVGQVEDLGLQVAEFG
jgi:hypothetical protein